MEQRKLIEHLSEFVTEKRLQTFQAVLENRTRYITVVLEDIFQTHNASAVLRTCECFGIQDIYTIENRNVFKPNREVDMGSSKWLSVYSYHKKGNKTIATIKELKKRGYRIISTTPHKRATHLHNFDILKGKVALFFGTELTGLSEEAMSFSDEHIKIPVYGFTESFNISVSVSVILYKLTEKLRLSPVNWQLSAKEKEILLFKWLSESIRSSDKIIERFVSNK